MSVIVARVRNRIRRGTGLSGLAVVSIPDIHCLMSAHVSVVRSTSAERVDAGRLSRGQLLLIAVARGCRHYAPLLPSGAEAADIPELSHEELGAALLRGPADAETFQAVRCGAMVLSDLGNAPDRIKKACERFGVAGRVAHIARIALEADDHPAFWKSILSVLPADEKREEFLPDASRFVSETRMAGRGRKPVRTWLRTHYAR